MMSVKQSVKRELKREAATMVENLPQYRFVHHKAHMI
jgi:hypothetical protein